MIIVETILLAVTGAVVGMSCGSLTVWYFAQAGINLGWFSEWLAYFGLPVMLYPVLPTVVYTELMAMVIGTALVGALYPAVKAVRLNPAVAIRSYG